jgi:Arc/MetJ-type ribon-helix-helix transcriptional regulator
MSTYKRRIVYLSDIEWTALQAQAHERRTTISAVIRQAVRGTDDQAGDRAARHDSQRPTAQAAARPAATRSAQAHRDEILKRVNRATSV